MLFDGTEEPDMTDNNANQEVADMTDSDFEDELTRTIIEYMDQAGIREEDRERTDTRLRLRFTDKIDQL